MHTFGTKTQSKKVQKKRGRIGTGEDDRKGPEKIPERNRKGLARVAWEKGYTPRRASGNFLPREITGEKEVDFCIIFRSGFRYGLYFCVLTGKKR